ncbi:CDP-diacylglycerol diphosphatase [Trinickia dabaoshanensis]|uniref:CDP-diacylglycerol pyrophosphatase n=1 Tax=Trinickia dabaoshanensis TaxID=564714 RepID=A0A2N7VXY4_9BURK|nr:CDP-diacylglycerol diphosphatase [Trinickia dabaoshanensis]PMS22001.1 CDP-diacylglycerol diphosphatase [Trinickia dabaoshanensis]
MSLSLRSPRRSFILAACAALFAAGCSVLAAADPNALWQIVDLDCVPAARTTGKTGICATVDLPGRYALLKDRSGVAQHLLIPTDRISGVESPLLLTPNAPNYWADAWDARRYVEAALKRARRAPLPDDRIGLEINSAMRRSQEQLHIHIDCMHADATAALARHREDPPRVWTWDTIDGTRYRIMRIPGPAFDFNPFDLVAGARSSPDVMASQTIFVTGAGASASEAGWLVLNSSLDTDGGTGSAETLLDHGCTAAAPL